jgi:SAM-dependent methyltransferase
MANCGNGGIVGFLNPMPESFQEPEFWDSRYREGGARWELDVAPGQFLRWMGGRPDRGSVLIPGCGSGLEIAALASAGWKVTAIDFAPTAIARARARADGSGATLIQGDFFAHPFAPGSFDVVYERTFLTALSPDRWPACAARYAGLLAPDGVVAGYCLYGHEPEPPPFFQPPDAPALAGHFQLREDAPSEDALPFFGARERWQVWGKKPAQ